MGASSAACSINRSKTEMKMSVILLTARYLWYFRMVADRKLTHLSLTDAREVYDCQSFIQILQIIILLI